MLLPRRSVPFVVVVLLLAACGGPEPSSPRPAASAGAASPATDPAPTATEVAASPSDPPSDAPSATPRRIADEPPSLALEVVAEGLAAPIGIISTFGEDVDGGLYLADRASGTIYRVVAGD